MALFLQRVNLDKFKLNYGSLVVYQKEVKAELSDYAKHHGADAVSAVFQALCVSDSENQADLAKAFSAVMTGII